MAVDDEVTDEIGAFTRRCFFDACRYGRREFEVPRGVFDDDGNVKDDVRVKMLPNGVYISRCGEFYCTLRCWSDLCSD
jgi:hypothetical protein